MKRKLALFASAISVLLLGSVALIYRVTSPSSPAPEGPAVPPVSGPAVPRPGPAGPALAAVPGQPAAAPPRLGPPPVVSLEAVPAPVPEPPPAWLQGASPSLAPTLDATALGPLKPFVAAGMGNLQRRVADCDREAPPGASRERRGKRVTLTLHFETLDNQLRIVDATPGDAESSTDWRVQCAQQKLRGQLIPAPSRKGEHFEVPFVLNL